LVGVIASTVSNEIEKLFRCELWHCSLVT
jgi:hypothetical protein